MIWFPPSLPVSKLDRRHTGRLRKRDNYLMGEGGVQVGAKADDGAKAWSSINYSILSSLLPLPALVHIITHVVHAVYSVH
jgi:hypothetical protein